MLSATSHPHSARSVFSRDGEAQPLQGTHSDEHEMIRDGHSHDAWLASGGPDRHNALLASGRYDSSSEGSDVEAPVKANDLKMGRLGLPLSLFALVAFVAIACSFYIYQGPRGRRAELGGFQEYQFAPVATWIRPKEGVCGEGVVLNSCLRIKSHSAKYFGSAVEHEVRDTIALNLLAEHFMVSRGSFEQFLKQIGTRNTEDYNRAATGHFAVDCMELCKNTVAAFPFNTVPPWVDTGCFFEKANDPKPWCSVDLSLSVLDKNIEIDHDPKAENSELLVWKPVKFASQQQEQEALLDKNESEMGEEAVFDKFQVEHPDVPYPELLLEVARMFRIYPASKAMVTEEDLSSVLPPPPAPPPPPPLPSPPDPCATSVKSRRLQPEAKADDSCKVDGVSYAHNGHCDTPISCPYGTDCTDCGTCGGVDFTDACIYRRDGKCDEPRWCMPHTDCTDCDTCGGGPHKTPEMHVMPNMYERMVLTRAVEATALASLALQTLAAHLDDPKIKKWIGRDTPELRAAMRHTFSSLQRVIDNMDFVFPGPECQAQTYAYVVPGLPVNQNAAANFKFYMCKKFMDADSKTQLSVLLHQSLRQGNVLAEEVELDGTPVYGMSMVKKLAAKCEKDGGSWCIKATRNADTLMYAVEEFARTPL